MFDYYRAQRTEMDIDPEQLLVQRSEFDVFLKNMDGETVAAKISIKQAYPDRVTNLMRRGHLLMQRMFDYYRAQRTRMDTDLEQLLVQRLEEQHQRIGSML